MEEWRKIPGYEKYEINSFGTVRRGERILSCAPNKYGYPIVRLWKNNAQKSELVSRLVALIFIQNPENKPTVDHIDRDPMNNNVINLRWATRTEQNLNRHYEIGKSGHKSINYDQCRDSWKVQIWRNCESVFAKRFKTLPEAIEARDNFLAISAFPPP